MIYIKPYNENNHFTKDYLSDLEDYLQEIFDKYHIVYNDENLNVPSYKIPNRIHRQYLRLIIFNIPKEIFLDLLKDIKDIKPLLQTRLGFDINIDYTQNGPGWYIEIYFNIPTDHYRKGQG